MLLSSDKKADSELFDVWIVIEIQYKKDIMKRIFPIALVVMATSLLSSCAAIEGIFKAGVWSGVIMVVVVLALLIWILAKLFGGRKD